MAIPSIFRPAPMIHEASSTGSPRRCVHRLAMTCSLSGGISISNCTPFDGICQRTTGCFKKLHRGCGKIFGIPQIPSPGGTPQGGLSCPFGAIHLRVARRAGRGIRAETYKPEQHHRPLPGVPLRQHSGVGLHISKITTLPPAFLISHGSALGRTHDSFPPGEAMGAAAPEKPLYRECEMRIEPFA